MTNATPLSLSDLRSLAPEDLRSYRSTRYTGDQVRVELSAFLPSDQTLIRSLYSTLLEIVAWTHPNAAVTDADLLARLKSLDWSNRINTFSQLGSETLRNNRDPLLKKVLHDIRGGAFLALSLQIELLLVGLQGPDDIRRIYLLGRDHLKMMRNGVIDMDPSAEAMDQTSKPHSIELIREKWANCVYEFRNRPTRIELDCRFDGNISERCLEFSALDRILYNLINNAARFTADATVHAAIFPVGRTGETIRFVISNKIHPEQKTILQEKFKGNLSSLFEGGFTTGGNGLGMSICLDFVSNAFGLGSGREALDQGYLGAKLLHDHHFVCWFHWPKVI